MIAFYFDNWQVTNFLKEIVTNIYNSFVLAEIFISFRNHFVFSCRFMIYHSICISWLNSDHSIAKHLDSFYSNNNFSKHFLCPDCHERRITYYRKRYRNLVQSYILAFISRSEMHFFFETRKKILQGMLCSIKLARTSKSIKTVNFYDDEYKFLNVRRWQITFSFLIDNEYFSIFDFNEFVNVLSFILFNMSFSRLDIILYISNLLSILNLIFYFLDYAIYHIWFESRLKSVTFFFVFKE